MPAVISNFIFSSFLFYKVDTPLTMLTMSACMYQGADMLYALAAAAGAADFEQV